MNIPFSGLAQGCVGVMCVFGIKKAAKDYAAGAEVLTLEAHDPETPATP